MSAPDARGDGLTRGGAPASLDGGGAARVEELSRDRMFATNIGWRGGEHQP
jgi:hypothetical protein